MTEVQQLLLPDPNKGDQEATLQAVIIVRKFFPWTKQIKEDIHVHIDSLLNKNSIPGFKDKSLMGLIARLNKAPSLTRGILQMAGEVDSHDFEQRAILALDQFFVPRVLEPLGAFNRLFRRGVQSQHISYLLLFSDTIQNLKEGLGISPSSLFLMDALLKAYQANNDYFFGTATYHPWKDLNQHKRVKKLMAFSSPLIQLPSKLNLVDQTVDFLHHLHSSHAYYQSDEQRYELVNFWAETIQRIPLNLELFESLSPESVRLMDQLAASLTDKDRLLLSLRSFLDRASSKNAKDPLPSLLHKSLFPALTTYLSDERVIGDLSSTQELPFIFESLLVLNQKPGLFETSINFFQNEEEITQAIDFSKNKMDDPDGMFKTAVLLKNLLITSKEPK